MSLCCRITTQAGRALETGAEDQTWLEPAANPFSWELLNTFGAFPAVLDRHVTEFFPQFFRDGQYFGATLGKDAWPFEAAVERGDAAFERLTEEAFSPDPLPEDYLQHLAGEHEQVLEIVRSIRANQACVYSANLPNTGQLPNLPEEAIVESPAVSTAAGLRPLAQPPLPSALVGDPGKHVSVGRDHRGGGPRGQQAQVRAVSRDRRCDQVAGRGRTTRRRPPLGPARPPLLGRGSNRDASARAFWCPWDSAEHVVTLGYRNELYLLAFDHRRSIERMLGIAGPHPTSEEVTRISEAKLFMYDGFQRAAVDGVRGGTAGILIGGKQAYFSPDIPSVAGESGPRYHRQAPRAPRLT